MQTSVVDRFLRYVTYDTQSREGSDTYPSTASQLVLLRDLVDELKALGITDASMDERGYVMATIPATSPKPGVPVIGVIAHVDTSPEMSGAGVKPLVHRAYAGQDLVLPDDPAVVLRVSDSPYLGECIGHDIITASGTTLLGADNKAGVAEIMAAAEYLLQHPEILHGAIRIAFTPDEEVGQGTKYFDVQRFGAAYAYTMDGGMRGELEFESFSADTFVAAFKGFNTHPGYAQGRMINSIKLAARFIGALPSDRLSPETTAGYDGYVHPYVLQASVDKTTVRVLLRDFVTAGLAEKARLLESLARDAVAGIAGASVECKVEESYRNMREVIDQHPIVVERAKEAIARAGLEVRTRPIRGGTDGSRLSFMGLPTPNIFNGSMNFHGKKEWVPLEWMDKSVETVLHLLEIWVEKTGARG
jgi:tripeptide aminopeptidase